MTYLKARAVVVGLIIALTTASCGYFNSLYNARKEFAQAERQRLIGQGGTARQGYIGSIEKAARSYRKYPNGRWADDALYLIGRSRFRLGEYAEAEAAFAELLAKTTEPEMRAGALAYAGATAVNRAAPAAAIVHLDAAISALAEDAALRGFAHLWRARARAANGDLAGAWSDLDAVTRTDDAEYSAVQLERLNLAIASQDSARAGSAFAALLAGRNVRRSMDTLNVLATRASLSFGATATRSMMTQPPGAWADAPRDSLALIRARLAVEAGDTFASARELTQLASQAAGPTAWAARVLLVRSRLSAMDRLEQLADARAVLLPALALGEAQQLIRSMRMVDVLVQRSAETGQPVALFTAAELARDELRAPGLARRLFVAFADIAAQSPWAAKALLAAIALAPADPASNDLRARLAALPENPYSSITRGESATDAYDAAEDRLARTMIVLRDEASQLAAQREGAVTRAIAVLDSLTAAARTDTLRIACGMMLDTLSLKGMRADSVRTACMRSDTTSLALYLTVDTMTWLPGFVGRDSVRAPLRGRRTTTPRPSTDSIK